jgi:hypothetical protein
MLSVLCAYPAITSRLVTDYPLGYRVYRHKYAWIPMVIGLEDEEPWKV